MVELALIAPLFLLVLFGIVILGVGVFYQQQLSNAAREAARYAVIHSATSDCPTVAWRDPDISATPKTYYRCDAPSAWPFMTGHARSAVFGMPRSDVHIAACWSGYWTKDNLLNWAAYDAPPPTSTLQTFFRPCTIGGSDPNKTAGAINCPATTSPSDDMASDLSSSGGISANQVTVYACYNWQPPLAGFLLIPSVVPLRAVVTQGMEYQQ